MIYETIVTTTSAQGEIHIAPFGIQWRDGFVVISPFKPSATLQNIMDSGCAVLNLTDDVRVFAAAIARKTKFATLTINGFPGNRLQECLAYHTLTLHHVEEDDLRPKLWMEVTSTVSQGLFKGFNRAQAAVIELAVLVSRLHMLPPEKIMRELEYLQIAIDKTAGPQELEAWQWLLDCVNNHMAQQTGMQQA